MELVTYIITLLVGSAIFITGMNMMSGGLKKATGRSLKRIFKKTQNNRFACLGIGAGVTALIQSSAATCVLAIGFINAGVMTVFQGLHIMIGAYIGTTVTGILASLSSFDFSIYLIALSFVGIVMMYFKKDLVKNIGEILCGFGLLFFGLKTMSEVFKSSVQIQEACQTLFSNISFPLLLLLIGALVTALVQSSSATTGIVIAMIAGNAIPFSSALYIALGATIGTCITTIISTIGGTTNAKRTGYVTLIMKVVGGLLATLIIWPLQDYIGPFFETTFGSAGFGLAIFVLVYNIIFAIVMVPLVRPFIKLGEVLIKDKEAVSLSKQILYIDDRLLSQPDIALMETKNEILNMFSIAMDNFTRGYNYMVYMDKKEANLIVDAEASVDYINNRITQYLIALSPRVDHHSSSEVGSYFHVINDIERIGDHAYNFYESAKELEDNDLRFSEVAAGELKEMYDIIMKMYNLTIEIFQFNREEKLKELHALEDRSDVLKTELSTNHYKRMLDNQCSANLSDAFATFLSELERVADHLTNIGYSIVNPTGDEI